MDQEHILTQLCYYDKRNPDCSMDDEEIQDHQKQLIRKNKRCYCDSCFYGTTELAEEILKLQGKINVLQEIIKK